MEALISGSAGLAAFISGDNASLVNCEGNTLHSSKYADVARQFESYDDTILLAKTDAKEALKVLQLESDRSDALLLILSILDSQVPSDVKPELASSANELLEKDSVLAHIRGILFARPLPGNSVSESPQSIQGKFPVVELLMQQLLESQGRIEKVYSLWMDTAQKFGMDENDVQRIEGTFAWLGVGFKLSQKNISSSDYSSLNFECLDQLKSIQNGRQIVTVLLKSFKDLVFQDKKADWPTQFNKTKAEALPKQSSSTTSHQLYEQAKSQIQRIIELLQAGDINHAEKFTEELVNAQVIRNDNAYAAKSLCQLSEAAKSIGNFSLQLNWAKKATEVEPSDGRTYGHVADAYLNLSQLEQARCWFEKSVQAGERTFGNAGIARIERTLFNYEHSLELIESVIDEEPGEYLNSSLKAELLRDLSRLDDAAALYKQLIEEFPDHSKPMCGLAAVLTDQRKFGEAEVIYRQAIRLYPHEQVPLTGLGFLLARQGRFVEAFKFLDQGILLGERGDVIPKMAKATALRMKGKFTKAEAIYKELICTLPHYAESRLELIDILARDGRYEEAIEELKIAKNQLQGNVQVVNHAEALLFKHQFKFVEALAILDSIKAKHPRWTKALLDRASVLKQLGQLEEARKQYEEILTIRPLERRARMGMDILDAVTAPRSSANAYAKNITEEKYYQLITIDDWMQLNIQGLILLSKNNPKEAKEMLLRGFDKNPFGSIKADFAVSLAAARSMLGQYGTAITSIKNVSNDFGRIQKAIVYGEQGKFDAVEKNLSAVRHDRPDTKRVIELVTSRYLKKKNAALERPSVNQVIEEQVRTILLAA